MPMSQRKIDQRQRVVRTPMQTPPLDPDVADTAPSDTVLTAYDEEHLITYLRLLEADLEEADWREVARLVLHLDPEHEVGRAPEGVREPFIASQVDDGARLPAPATWRRVRLIRPANSSVKATKEGDHPR
jgi:hypothetical protein